MKMNHNTNEPIHPVRKSKVVWHPASPAGLPSWQIPVELPPFRPFVSDAPDDDGKEERREKKQGCVVDPLNRRTGDPSRQGNPYGRNEGECPRQGDPFDRSDRGIAPEEKNHPLVRSGMIRFYLPLLLLAASWLLHPATLSAQTVQAFTNSSGTVLLMWSPDSINTGIRYNIYRKEASEPSWSATPINPSPIGPITNCTTFKTIIPSGSATWTMLSNALADSTGGVPPIVPLADVCSITSLSPGNPKYDVVQIFAGYIPEVARVMGQGYQENASVGKTYTYRVVKVTGGGTELPLEPGASVTIKAGTPGVIPVPGGLQAISNDGMIQIIWTRPADPKFQSFIVERRNGGGPWSRVNDVVYSALIYSTINQDTLIPARHGFTDYQRYDQETGDRISHPVPNPPGADINVNGPLNGTTYDYRVRHRDPLGIVGNPSGTVSATPHDSTRPGSPQGLIVTANEEKNGFDLRWNIVYLDSRGHQEDMKGYRIYRYEQPEDPNSGATLVAGPLAQPPGDTAETMTYSDLSSGLRSPCGDKTYYYRVEAEDLAGNRSFRSIAVGDALKDTTRPENVKGTEAEGFDEYIQVRWDLNSDCDIDEYRIYRAYCNYGDWLPCPDSTYTADQQKLFRLYLSSFNDQQRDPKQTTAPTHIDPKGQKPYDCGGPFYLVGTITHLEAKERKEAKGKAYFDDLTVPAGSTICYAYLVKAVDRSQNESGSMPIPDPTKEIVVCQKLRDRTPPGPAIISGLFARDSAVIVEWIGPPIQDIAAWHVYRSTTENGTYTWVGGRTVAPPPATGINLAEPYKPPPVVGCDNIPLVSHSWMSSGRIIDTVDPHMNYFYKVVGIDQEGNETSPDSAVAIGTFSFKSNRWDAPEISSIVPTDDPCGLEVAWNPPLSDSLKGFAVFRCLSAAGDYYQVGSVVSTSSYVDRTVARNTTYWYRVAMLKKDGSLSNLSDPMHGVHP